MDCGSLQHVPMGSPCCIPILITWNMASAESYHPYMFQQE